MEELDGEALVFDPVTADTHRLNETALFIWRCCDGRAVEEIAQGMCDAYDVGFEEATGHVERMVSELGERALVSEATDDGSGTA